MNPYLIIGFIVALIFVGAGGFKVGDTYGTNQQKAADQEQFDDINQKLAGQKTEAAGILKTKNAENLALMVERDTLKTNLEKEHAQAQAATAAARDHFAGLGLRFQPAEAAGCRLGSGCAGSPQADPSGAHGAAVVELPAAVTASLRSIAYDADTLADSYRECYGYAQQVK
jgi:hypothetical protein